MFWLVFWLALVCVIGFFALLARAAEKRQRMARQNHYRGSTLSLNSRNRPVRTRNAYRPASYEDEEEDAVDKDDYGDRCRVQAAGTIIYHPHVIDLDDYECSVCGRRFSKNRVECPYCNARFTDWKTDDMEFLEEEDELESWDEEEGW